MNTTRIKEDIDREKLWDILMIALKGFDKIQTTHSDSGTLKKIAKETVERMIK